MSVAFRRDSDEEHLEPKFELPIPPGPNFVTPAGLAQIEERVAALEAALDAGGTDEALKPIKRDLRYWRQRASSAQPAPVPADGTVGIGSHVRFTLRGKAQAMTITGHDEADPAAGKIAFSSPLARALLGLVVGDLADFACEEDAIEVVAIDPA